MSTIHNLDNRLLGEIASHLGWKDQLEMSSVSTRIYNTLAADRKKILLCARLYRTRLFSLLCDARAVLAARHYLEIKHPGTDADPVMLEFTSGKKLHFTSRSMQYLRKHYDRYMYLDQADAECAARQLTLWSIVDDPAIGSALLKPALRCLGALGHYSNTPSPCMSVPSCYIDTSQAEGLLTFRNGVPKAMLLCLRALTQTIWAVPVGQEAEYLTASKTRIAGHCLNIREGLTKIVCP